MATKIGSLFGDVSLRTASLDKDIAKVGKKLKKMGAGMTSLGKNLSAKVTAPIVGIGVASLKAFGDFEKGMNEVRSLMPDLNQGEFEQLQTDLRGLSVEMGTNVVGATKAMYQAISAGVPKDNVIDFLRTASRSAIAGVTDVETAVDGLTTVLNAYKMESDQAEHVSDVLFTAVKLGKTNFEQLSASMFQVAPLAAAMNVPLEEVAAAVTTLTKQGVPTSVAMTQIRASMVGLQKPTATMKEALSDLGFASGQALLDAKGYLGALETLRTESGLTGEELAKAFKSVEGLGAVLSQTGENFDGAVSDLEAMTQAGGSMFDAFKENNKGLWRSLQALGAILRDVGIEVGTHLAPYITDVAEKCKAWYDLNKESIPQWVDLGVKVAAFAAAMGPLLIVMGQMALVLSNIITAGVALGAGLAVLLIKFEVLKEAGEAFGDAFTAYMDGRILDSIGHVINGMWEFLKTFNPLAAAMSNMFAVAKPIFSWIVDAVAGAVTGIGKLISGLMTVAKYTPGGLAGQAVGKLADIAFRAAGGPVSSGSPYIVGEQGPELFVPKYSGGIVPNHAMGGGGMTVHQHFTGNWDMAARAALKNMKPELVRWAVDGVAENNLRTV